MLPYSHPWALIMFLLGMTESHPISSGEFGITCPVLGLMRKILENV